MEQYAAQIIGAIVLAILIWIARETHTNGRELVSIKTRLFGDEREPGGGLAGEVKHLRTRQHELANDLHEHGLRIQALEEQP